MVVPTNPSAAVEALLRSLVPQGQALPRVQVSLAEDECRWLLAGLDAGLFRFQECNPRCPRLRRHHVSGPDEFLASSGGERHLYSSPGGLGLRLNREYIPHLAAHARGILQLGYPRELAKFSEYGQFREDRITKKRGQAYEIDSLFSGADHTPRLHLEAKTKPREVERIAHGIDRFRHLTEMPRAVIKEIEYVLELTPAYFVVAIKPAR
jgi:hypothetical protein